MLRRPLDAQAGDLALVPGSARGALTPFPLLYPTVSRGLESFCSEVWQLVSFWEQALLGGSQPQGLESGLGSG